MDIAEHNRQTAQRALYTQISAQITAMSDLIEGFLDITANKRDREIMHNLFLIRFKRLEALSDRGIVLPELVLEGSKKYLNKEEWI